MSKNPSDTSVTHEWHSSTWSSGDGSKVGKVVTIKTRL